MADRPPPNTPALCPGVIPPDRLMHLPEADVRARGVGNRSRDVGEHASPWPRASLREFVAGADHDCMLDPVVADRAVIEMVADCSPDSPQRLPRDRAGRDVVMEPGRAMQEGGAKISCIHNRAQREGCNA